MKNKPSPKHKDNSTSTNKKQQNKTGINKRDAKEVNAIIREKNKLDIIKAKLSDKKKEIEETKGEINKLFAKSNGKETELKNYIAELNSKMLNVDSHSEDRIDEVHKSIMSMIAEIQEKIKMEINFTKKEMEKEVLNKFFEAEQNQQKLMNDKIDEQKKVFEKMNSTKNEIEQIKKHFEQTNTQCESMSKENESLRIHLQSFEEDNKSLEKKLKMIRQEYILLAKEHKVLFKNEDINNPFNIEYSEAEDEDENEVNKNGPSDKGVHMNTNNPSIRIEESLDDFQKASNYKLSLNNLHKENINSKTQHNFMPKINNKLILNHLPVLEQDSIDQHPNELYKEYHKNPEGLIDSIKQNIKDVKIEYKNIHTNFIEEIKQRNEAQQLLQKCIEDLKLEINKTSKGITNFTKSNQAHIQLHNNYSSGNKKYEEQLAAKQNHLSSLENKFKILTFVYDNGFQNTKMKKNKLFASTTSYFYSSASGVNSGAKFKK